MKEYFYESNDYREEMFENMALCHAGMREFDSSAPFFTPEGIGFRLKALATDFITTPLKKAFNFGAPLTIAELWGARKILNINNEEKRFLNGAYMKEVEKTLGITTYAHTRYSKTWAERRANDFIEKMSYDVLEKYQDQMEQNPKLAEKIKGTILNDKIKVRENRVYFEHYDMFDMDDLERADKKEEMIKKCFSEIKKLTGQEVCWDYEMEAPYLENSEEVANLIKKANEASLKYYGGETFHPFRFNNQLITFYKIDDKKAETLINKLTTYSKEKKYQCEYRIMSDGFISCKFNNFDERELKNPIEEKMVSVIDKEKILARESFSSKKDVVKLYDEYLSNQIFQFSEMQAELRAIDNGEIGRKKVFKYENTFSNENDLKNALLAINETEYEKWKTIKYRRENYDDFSLSKEAFVNFERQKNEQLAKDPEYAMAHAKMEKLKDVFKQYREVVVNDDFHKLNYLDVHDMYEQVNALQENKNLMRFERGEWQQLEELSEFVIDPFVDEYVAQLAQEEEQEAQQQAEALAQKEATIENVSDKSNNLVQEENRAKGRGR